MIYDRIKLLCKQKGVSVNQLEKELSISRGALCRIDVNKPGSEKLQKLSDYFGVSIKYLLTGETDDEQGYYLNKETAKAAQEIFENKELRMLFDVQRDMSPEDLRALHGMALALKRKERGNDDDTGC